jgi:hypothetical protein
VTASSRLTADEFLLDPAEIILEALQRGGTLDQKVELKVIADRHLVEQSTEL